MIHRRQILTGLGAVAALPATPALAKPDTAPAVTPAALPVTDPAPVAAPEFIHAIDAEVWKEIEQVEIFIAKAKRQLLSANHPHPAQRDGQLFEMRYSFELVQSCWYMTWNKMQVEQRAHVKAASEAWKRKYGSLLYGYPNGPSPS